MKYPQSAVAVIPIIMGVLIGVGELNGAKAEEIHAYVVASNDGYGLEECLSDAGGACGQVVADAWCEAHGHGAAVSFGPQSLFGATKISTAAEPYVVNCRD